ncbi:polysaccharide deacetylase family protein [Duganella dendranthematis]|uniref:Polysaccharide deacetylase family protein n=1 Tax=Duganella dendranthematis TaxID=2728021 RepID=A0ABX6MAL4_9BURK|nr:polysaccharide deacetylase family protein [Duganella dendranthematis]QJD91155.1 polysaccharide deacetylase family protein [Duganella dendranthematis]
MKITTLQVLAAAWMSVLTGVVAAQNGVPFQWPHGAQAAVSLAYDDALDSQLDIAIPALDRAGLKGSFYLQLSNPAVDKRMAEWRTAARNGHELGNHSLFHQCSRRAPGHDWVQPQRDLDTTSVAQMQDQVMLGNTMLYAIDSKRERTYTVPCGDTLAAGADYLKTVAPAFVAIKVGGEAVTPSMATLNPSAVGVYAPEGLSGQQLIAIVQQAAAKGTMVNFTFHGVGGDYLTTSAAAHEELVQYLAANRQRYWTDTFLNIMTYVKTQRGDH